MEEIKRQKNIRALAILCIVVFAGLVLYALVSWILTVGKIKVRVVYAPFAATVRLDDVTLKNNSDNYITPGVYRLTVEFQNFETLTKEIEVKNDTKYLFASLDATNSDGEAYAKEHADEFLAVEGIAGQLDSEAGLIEREKILEKAPVVAFLPVKNSLFTISYEMVDDEVRIIISTVSDTYVNEATKKFKSLLNEGDVAAEYNIVFSGFNDLFASATFADNNFTSPEDFLRVGFSGVPTFDFVDGTTCGDRYYCAKISTGRSDSYSLVNYYTILENRSGKWYLVAKPAPILTVFNTDDLSADVIDYANSL